MNPYYEGQSVVCIDDVFPIVYSEISGDRVGDIQSFHPQKNEILVIDEVMGDYLNFAKYDTENSKNFWHHIKFAPIDDSDWIDKQITELVKEVELEEA